MSEPRLNRAFTKLISALICIACIVGYYYEINHPYAPRLINLPGGIMMVTVYIIGASVSFVIVMERGL